MMNGIRTRLMKGLVVTGMAWLAGCDTGVAPEDHFEGVARVEIADLAGALIAEWHDDHWDFEGGGNALRLQVGEELEVRIYFVAEDGDRFQLPPTGAEHTLNVEILNTAIAEFEAHANDGHFLGKSVGTTGALIQVYHGTHADWQANPALPIEVVD